MFPRFLLKPCVWPVTCIVAVWAAAARSGAAPVTLRTPALEFRLDPASGAHALRDREARVEWASDPAQPRLGLAEGFVDGRPQTLTLGGCAVRRQGNHLELTFRPAPQRPELAFRVWIRTLPDNRTLELTWDADPGLGVRQARLLDRTFAVGDRDAGGVLVPVRRGLLIPSDSGRAFQHTFDTYAYEGCHLAMLGVLKRGAALLVHWRDPYTHVEVTSEVTGLTDGATAQVVRSSLVLQQSGRRFCVALLGRGDHITVGRAYRQAAEQEGWRVPWERKLAAHPDRARLLGASNCKLWSLLDRRMDESGAREERVTVNWTFDEAARVAEHLRHDLQLERVLFLMGGWIHRGYDNQHPDILPAAPECGGDPDLAVCARRIRALGYVLSLHDNYQDIYRDSPSWDERLIMKRPDGSLVQGGRWAGGRAYLTCSRMALGLAQRPQNLPAVLRLTAADAYFIDTTYAAGLLECFDPEHPLTRHDDMYWKQALSDYARGLFGIFGSECGREWALPHSDFFEGLVGVSGRHLHDANLEAKLGAVSVPLFEAVYRECIAAYGKYGYDIHRAAGYVLDHLIVGRPLHYHNVPPRLYWRERAPDAEEVLPAIGEFEPVGAHRFLISYRWNVRRVPARDWRVFVHYTTPAGEIVFQDDHDPDTPSSQWNVGAMEFGTFGREVPAFLRGTFDIRMGLFDPASARRALLPGRDDGERRYLAGRLTFTGERILFEPVEARGSDDGDPAVFARGDGGWSDGLHPFDRFVKNTHEVLSPLNEITGRMPLTAHRFLSPDRKTQQSVFGAGADAVVVTVHAGPGSWRVKSSLGGEVELPTYGFLVESRGWVAFHAATWAG